MEESRKLKHELRTPVNHIIGYSALLLESAQDAGDDEVAREVGRIQEFAAHVNRVIEGVLLRLNGMLDDANIATISNAIVPLQLQVETQLQCAHAKANESIAADLEKVLVAIARLQALLAGAASMAT